MALKIYNCKKCGHEWASDKEKWKDYPSKKPFQCPKCKSAKWDIDTR